MRVEVRKLGSESVQEARILAEEADCAFRAPHHSVSSAGLIGELALSAGGVLFLDEVDEFRGSSLATLRNHLSLMREGVRPTLFLTTRDGTLSEAVRQSLNIEGDVAAPSWRPSAAQEAARQKVLDAGVGYEECEVDSACEVHDGGKGTWAQVWIYLTEEECP